MTHRLVSLGLSLATLSAAACASKGPPPRVAEVPIDDAPAGSRGPVPVTVEAEPEASTDPAGGGAAGGAGAGLLPAMTAMGAGTASNPGTGGSSPSSKPPPPQGERLSAAECNQVMDKYIELVGISQGISRDAIGGVMSMLRNSVANDPNYSGALGACVKENTKTQFRCAMRANDVAGWNKCLK